MMAYEEAKYFLSTCGNPFSSNMKNIYVFQLVKKHLANINFTQFPDFSLVSAPVVADWDGSTV